MSINDNLALPKKYAAQKIINLLTMGALFGIIIWSIYFVYEYTYQTLNNVDNIIILSSDIGVNTIDIHAYEASQKNLKTKSSITNPPNVIRNIFYYVQPNNAAKGTTTSKK